jgi:hypothetical protein
MSKIDFKIKDKEKCQFSVNIKKVYPDTNDLEITPSKSLQVHTPNNCYGYDKVTVNPIPDDYIIPSGNINISSNGSYDVNDISRVDVNVYTIPKLQSKEITPTKDTQIITSNKDYDGLNQVKVNPIPDDYIIPTGTIEITENGEHNVKHYDNAIVNIESSGGVQQPFLIACGVSENSSTTTASIDYMNAQGKYNLANNTANMIIFVGWVRSDYTLSSNITLLAETEYFTNGATNQKLVVGICDITSTENYVITQTNHDRITAGYIRLSNCDTPEVILNEIGTGTNITMNTDDNFNIYLVSHILNASDTLENFSYIFANGVRTKLCFSNYPGEKKITLGVDNYYGLIGLRCKFKQSN